MTTVACPRCRDEVTVPPHVSDEALVRCPLCSEEYTLSEATRRLPPMLVVVGPSKVVPVTDSDGGDDLALAEPDMAPRPVVLREKPQRRPAGRGFPARRPKNPLVEVLKIVGGGVIGLAIGQLILWWMPGDWDVSNRDPANLASSVARYVPWLVPAELHPLPVAASGSATPPAEPPVSVGAPRPAAEPKRSPVLDTEPDALEPFALEGPLDAPPPASERSADTASDTGTDTATEAGAADVDEEPADDSATPAADGDESLPLDDATDAEAAEPAAAADATDISDAAAEEPAGLVAEVENALGNWDREAPAASAGAAVDALRRASAGLSRVGAGEEPARAAEEKLRALIELVFDDEAKLAALTAASRARPLASVEAGEGVVLIGTLETLTEAGALWEVQLAHSEGETVTVLAPRSVTPTLALHQQLLVLGTLVADPRAELASYNGDAERAIFSRLVMPVGP